MPGRLIGLPICSTTIVLLSVVLAMSFTSIALRQT
jgi:hypothetical protein